jgi:hypothetical protein
MAAPSTPPSSAPAPPGSAYSPPPQGWSPPVAYAAPPAAPRAPMNFDSLAFLLRMVGFIAIFAGAVVAAAFGSPSGSCFFGTASTAQSCVQGVANAVLTARIFLAVGAFLLGAGAGLKLHFVLKRPSDPSPEAFGWVLFDRLVNYGLILVAIVLLWWVVDQAALLSLTNLGSSLAGGA